MGRWWRSNGFNTRAELFKALNSLYPGGGWEDSEAELIRFECEKLGLPMGYGRVRAAPSQLTGPEAGGQFRWRSTR